MERIANVGRSVLPGSQGPPPWAVPSRLVENLGPGSGVCSLCSEGLRKVLHFQTSVSLSRAWGGSQFPSPWRTGWRRKRRWWVSSYYIKVRNCHFHSFYYFFLSSSIGFILFRSKVLLHGQKLLCKGLWEWTDHIGNPWNGQMSSQEGVGGSRDFDSVWSSFFCLSLHAPLFP